MNRNTLVIAIILIILLIVFGAVEIYIANRPQNTAFLYASGSLMVMTALALAIMTSYKISKQGIITKEGQLAKHSSYSYAQL